MYILNAILLDLGVIFTIKKMMNCKNEKYKIQRQDFLSSFGLVTARQLKRLYGIYIVFFFLCQIIK